MRRLLIIKWGALGDVVVATPHIEAILAAHPDAEAWLLTAPPYAPLFARHPRLHLLVRKRRGAWEMARTLAWVAARRFDAVFDLQGNDRSAVLTWCSRAPLRTGLGPAYAYTRIPASRAQRDRHIFERLNGLLTELGIPPAPPRPMLAVGPAEEARIDRWLGEHGLTAGAVALLHAGSSARWPSKRWPEAHFHALAGALQAAGIAPVWIGGEEDAALNRRLAADGGIDATGAFSLLELAALARRARFAVTSDSGPMHVVSSAGIPVYALFGPTDWRRNHPVGQGERVLRHPVDCSPCRLPECPPERHHACLDGLAAATVVARLRGDGLLE